MIHQIPNSNKTILNNNYGETKPYMGNFTSAQIGNLAKMGNLTDEYVNKLIKSQDDGSEQNNI